MADNNKINSSIPFINIQSFKPFDWKKSIKENPILDFSKLKPKKFEQPISEKLYMGWSSVMRKEAKNHISLYNPDPSISKQFFKAIEEYSKELNCNPEDFAALIYYESHFDSQCKNPSGKYCGLIQMDKMSFDEIFKDSDINYSQYCKLPREEQLKYAVGYLKYRIKEKNLKGKKLSGGQLWTLIKRPAAIKDKNFVNKVQSRIDSIKNIPQKHLPGSFIVKT